MEKHYIIGKPFLDNLYTVFDNEDKRIGLFRHVYSDIKEGDFSVAEETDFKKII